jgi:uncharacterized protein involved in exopolysaccharide biosynthesis
VEVVAILQDLWRRRLLVLVGVVLAIAAGAMLMTRPAPKDSAVALTSVTLDTPRSQVVDANPSGADTLAWRASMLADLMATEPVASKVARELGVPESDLAVVNPALESPEVSSSLPKNAAKAAEVTEQQHVLVLGYDEVLPIVSIEALAPSRAAATRLANAAADQLQAAATGTGTAELQGFVVEEVGPVRVEDVSAPSGKLKALAAVMVLLGAWCGAVALLPGIGRAWRAAGTPQPT